LAHFAEIDENNNVLRVLVVDDLYEDRGNEYLSIDCGLGGNWLKTSYNTLGNVHRLGGTPFRKNFAGTGMIYDEQRDAFLYPKPFPSWTLDENSCLWKAPVPRPDDEKLYYWDENSNSWQEQ
jgi:hypothetical protein